jgi:hypothetical protein
MVFDRSQPKISLAAIGGVLMLGALSMAPVQAAEDTNMFNSVLGFVGLQFDKDDQTAIDYRARAPLVLPPKMDLPPPQTASTHRPADWPVDPDVVKRRKELAESLRPAPQITPNTRAELTKEQLMANRGESVVVDEKPDNGCSAFAGTSMCVSSPWQYVSQKMGLAKKEDEKVVLSGQEPPRKYLTEPPPGYRVPTADTKLINDRVKAEPDAGDAQAYQRKEQRRIHSVDDN